ncbi:MAG: hypothetical protein HOC23_03090 [Halieaceae bacterium]|jgi:hypothetical protein|nr:hypothetical protein [Halieaceae bacterium]
MDSRLYFVLGDLGSNILVGLFVGWLCSLIVATGWNMAFTMILTMIIGMVIGTVLWLPLGILFGAMEVMLPVMFSGMLSGMVVGMWATMAPLEIYQAATAGSVCGLVSIVIVWVMNNSARGINYCEGES